MKIKILFSIIILIALSTCSIPRQDVIECGLKNGNKFILKAEYDWTPIAKIIPADVAERLNQDNFGVSYNSIIEKKTYKNLSGISFETLSTNGNPEHICAQLGEKNNIPYSFVSFIDKKTLHYNIDPQNKLYLSIPPDNKNKIINNELKIKNIHPAWSDYYIAITKIGNRIIYEHALHETNSECGKMDATPNPCPIVAVFKSESLDDGKNWENPFISKEAEIFELNKTILEQSFIARPIKINGKKFYSKFPR